MYMFKYILKRLGLMLMTFSIIMIICFTLVKMLPIAIDPVMGGDAKIMYEFLSNPENTEYAMMGYKLENT